MNLLDLGIEFRIATDIVLIAGLIGLGYGYYMKTQRRHLYRMAGLIAFGVFWVLQTPYFISTGDVFNGIVCLLALPFYVFLSYHEYLSYDRDEEIESLRWISGASFFAGGLYFLIDKIPILSGYLILAVAYQTVWLINLFGFNYSLGDINYVDNPLWYRTNYNEIQVPVYKEGMVPLVQIIQSCTAIQSMLIFIAAIYCVQAASRKKWIAFMATVPVIYVLNLIRNIGVIYMMDSLGWSYEVAHHEVGKGGSFIALIVLAAVVFKILPELLDNIWGLVDLKDRDKEPKDKTKEEGELEREDEVEEEIEEEPPPELKENDDMVVSENNEEEEQPQDLNEETKDNERLDD